MTPGDFKHTLLDEAHRLRRSVVAMSRGGADLDNKTAMWIVTEAGWREIVASADYAASHMSTDPGRPRTLLGLPVRMTIDDPPDAPMLQLVMEPMLIVRPKAP